MSTDVFGQLFESDESLSDEFKQKATVIFESAVAEKAKQLSEAQVEVISKELQEKFDEELEKIQTELATKIDESIQYFADKFLEENKLAIEKSTKVDIVEGFISGLKTLFEENYIEIPEDKLDYVAEMEQRVEQAEQKLNEEVKSNISLNKKISSMIKESIFAELSSGLSEGEVEKFTGLVESVQFDSEADYKNKLSILKDNYFNKAPIATNESDDSNVGIINESELDKPKSGATYIATKYKELV
jgi:hypothetical protein